MRFFWLAKKCLLLKINKELNYICEASLLYVGLIAIVSASVFKNVVSDMGEMPDLAASIVIYLGLVFAVFSFYSKIIDSRG